MFPQFWQFPAVAAPPSLALRAGDGVSLGPFPVRDMGHEVERDPVLHNSEGGATDSGLVVTNFIKVRVNCLQRGPLVLPGDVD